MIQLHSYHCFKWVAYVIMLVKRCEFIQKQLVLLAAQYNDDENVKYMATMNILITILIHFYNVPYSQTVVFFCSTK